MASKASEWAARQLESDKTYQELFLTIRTTRDGFYTRAHLHNAANVSAKILQGDSGEVTLLADEALVLARWIIDTFGEPDGA